MDLDKRPNYSHSSLNTTSIKLYFLSNYSSLMKAELSAAWWAFFLIFHSRQNSPMMMNHLRLHAARRHLSSLQPEMYQKQGPLPYRPVRLEQFYHESLLEDLLYMTYDHDSPDLDLHKPNYEPESQGISNTAERHLNKIRSPPSYLTMPEDPVKWFFSRPLEELETLDSNGEICSNLMTAVNARLFNNLPKRRWAPLVYNPIDYTTVGKDVIILGVYCLGHVGKEARVAKVEICTGCISVTLFEKD
jgi:hypothetical protein